MRKSGMLVSLRHAALINSYLVENRRVYLTMTTKPLRLTSHTLAVVSMQAEEARLAHGDAASAILNPNETVECKMKGCTSRAFVSSVELSGSGTVQSVPSKFEALPYDLHSEPSKRTLEKQIDGMHITPGPSRHALRNKCDPSKT